MVEAWLEKQKQANQYFQQRKYSEAVALYEESIEKEPTVFDNYWYLGLAWLLQGEEELAHTAWMTPILQLSEKEQEELIAQLSQILEQEAQNQESQQYLQPAWLIRQHLREISPENIDNLLKLLKLAIAIQNFPEYEDLLEKINQVLSKTQFSSNENLLLENLALLLQVAPDREAVIAFANVCQNHVNDSPRLVKLLSNKGKELMLQGRSQKAIPLGKICMQLAPNNPQILNEMTGFLQNAGNYLESISIAEKAFSKSNKWGDRLAALHSQIRGFIYAGGHWQDAYTVHQQHQRLLQEIATKSEEIEVDELLQVLSAGIFSAYFEDTPREYRPLRNQYAQLCQNKIQTAYQDKACKYKERIFSESDKKPGSKKLKIGYLSEYFYNHSISWIARWPLLYHDRERFEIHAYATKNMESSLQKTLETICYPNFHQLKRTIKEISNKIIEDEIDILVDLDSLTSHVNSTITALKLAPIQVTWLGFDASGLPAIDYFLADPYVLPESAGEFYTETIWRLPQTYVAVDGFEVAVPTLRRDRMEIPQDAVVYFSAQSGAKRNPSNVRAQIQILKEVPNSFLLVKNLRGEIESVKHFFETIAESEGVSSDRLRFLPRDSHEAIHRGNLRIADVVLDTYPYNGATTTLETLWMEIPLVTQVGEQFAARNSYTMLRNAGVTSGIAWNQEEYIEWGIRLGKNPQLRRDIAWQLRIGKQTEPLWNSEQFTRDLEQAYEQMWQKFVDES